MTKKTHLAAGILATTGVMMVAKEVSVPCALGIIGAVVPDWDMILGMKHRGISHSFIFAIGIGALLSVFGNVFALSFVLNYCLHIALDSLTVMRVKCYAPFSNESYGLGLIKTGSDIDLFLCLVFITAFGWMINLV